MILILELEMLCLKQKCSINGTFDKITSISMKILGYAYLHCDLLDKVILTTIILMVKSPHIDIDEGEF
jgi:hypothetical protein